MESYLAIIFTIFIDKAFVALINAHVILAYIGELAMKAISILTIVIAEVALIDNVIHANSHFQLHVIRAIEPILALVLLLALLVLALEHIAHIVRSAVMSSVAPPIVALLLSPGQLCALPCFVEAVETLFQVASIPSKLGIALLANSAGERHAQSMPRLVCSCAIGGVVVALILEFKQTIVVRPLLARSKPSVLPIDSAVELTICEVVSLCPAIGVVDAHVPNLGVLAAPVPVAVKSSAVTGGGGAPVSAVVPFVAESASAVNAPPEVLADVVV